MDDDPIIAEFSDGPPRKQKSLEERVKALEKKANRTDLWIVAIVFAVLILAMAIWWAFAEATGIY